MEPFPQVSETVLGPDRVGGIVRVKINMEKATNPSPRIFHQMAFAVFPFSDAGEAVTFVQAGAGGLIALLIGLTKCFELTLIFASISALD